MRAEEMITLLTDMKKNETEFPLLRSRIPLGVDDAGQTVFAQTREHPFTPNHICVTGTRRSAFIRRLLMHLSCLYEKTEVSFFILSKNDEYGELLRLCGADVTVPYVRTEQDVETAKNCLRTRFVDAASGKKLPKLFLVVDGVDETQNARSGDLAIYRGFYELIAQDKNVELITGVNLLQSIFSGNPGVFVGVGNCLITLREEGRADVTYVNDDSSLTMPIGLRYPDTPSILETVIRINAITGNAEKGE